MQYLFPTGFPFEVIPDFVEDVGEDGLELFGDEARDFLDPFKEIRGEEFLEDLPPFFIDPAGDGVVPFEARFSPGVTPLLLVLFVLYLLVYIYIEVLKAIILCNVLMEH